MDKQLIPIYREKELYTYFYDVETNCLYRLIHQKKPSFGRNFILMLFVLYGLRPVNRFYQDYQSIFGNFILIAVIVIIGYFGATKFYQSYYKHESKRAVFLDQQTMEKYAQEGLVQLRMEVLLGGGIGFICTVIGFGSFIVSSNIQLLALGCLGSVILSLIILMKPILRKKLLTKFEKREIDLG